MVREDSEIVAAEKAQMIKANLEAMMSVFFSISEELYISIR